MLRGALVSARADECEAMTGARDTFTASKNVLSETWEMSTSIPSRFISRTTSTPKGVSPPWCFTLGLSMSPEASAHSFVLLQVRVMYRTPSR